MPLGRLWKSKADFDVTTAGNRYGVERSHCGCDTRAHHGRHRDRVAFLDKAMVEYAAGNRHRGDTARAKAQPACDQAANRIRHAEARRYPVTSNIPEALKD